MADPARTEAHPPNVLKRCWKDRNARDALRVLILRGREPRREKAGLVADARRWRGRREPPHVHGESFPFGKPAAPLLTRLTDEIAVWDDPGSSGVRCASRDLAIAAGANTTWM